MTLHPSAFMWVLTLPLVVATALSGCSSGGATDLTTLTFDSSAPLADSDDSASALASAAYNAYLAAIAQGLASPGSDPTTVTAVTTGELQRLELESIGAARQSNQTTSGVSHVVNSRVRHASLMNVNASNAVSAEFCVDVSDTEVFDVEGTTITNPDRPLLLPFEAHFDAIEGILVASSSDIAKDYSICMA